MTCLSLVYVNLSQKTIFLLREYHVYYFTSYSSKILCQRVGMKSKCYLLMGRMKQSVQFINKTHVIIHSGYHYLSSLGKHCDGKE